MPELKPLYCIHVHISAPQWKELEEAMERAGAILIDTLGSTSSRLHGVKPANWLAEHMVLVDAGSLVARFGFTNNPNWPPNLPRPKGPYGDTHDIGFIEICSTHPTTKPEKLVEIAKTIIEKLVAPREP